MEILKIEQEEFKCPDCKTPLEFDGNELKEEFARDLKMLFSLGFYYPTTGNGWFYCNKCGNRYLIKDYAEAEVCE